MFKRITVVAFVFLSSCMKVGPDYQEPPLKVAKDWLYTSKYNDASVKEAQAKNANWWKIFNDPTLNHIIYKGYQDNLTLQTAGVRILFTRAQLAQSVGQLYPQQQALSGNYQYNRIGGSSLESLLPSHFTTASLGFGANWEIDFWGKYRRAIESNDAGFLASMAAYDNALVTLTADIASTYITIRTLEEQIKVTRQNIAVQQGSLNIVNSRYNEGQTSKLDVEQAQTQLSKTQAQLPSQKASLQLQKDKLAVLLGTVPNQVNALLQKNKKIPIAPKQIEVGIPKEVLAQRPDIAQARLQAIAQSAQIGATKAQLFPALSLAGTFSFASTSIGESSISDMFHWSNRNINAGPAFNWPILNYGQITNAVRMQDALFQQALLNYQNVVLKAQQEVQDFITQYIQAKQSVKILTKANRSALESTRLAIIRYKEGETIYTTVLEAQREQLQVQSGLAQAKGNVDLALAGLFRALGGGWQLRCGHDVIPMNIKRQMAVRTNWGVLLDPPYHLPPQIKQQKLEQLTRPSW